MHVLLTQGTSAGRWDIEVVGNDPATGTEVVEARYDVTANEAATRTGLYAQVQWKLLHNGFHTTGPWQEKGGVHRAPAEPNLKITTYAELVPDGYDDMAIVVFDVEPDGSRTTTDMLGLVFSRKLAAPEMYSQATAHLADKGYAVVGSWYATEYTTSHRAEVALQADRPSEADEMTATSETLALNAMRELDQKHAEVVLRRQAPERNYDYMRLSAALDAHCEQLAQLEWTRKIYAAQGAPLSGYPSLTAEIKKRLRAVIDAEKKMNAQADEVLIIEDLGILDLHAPGSNTERLLRAVIDAGKKEN